MLDDAEDNEEGENDGDDVDTEDELSIQEQDVDEDDVSDFGDDAANLDDANVAAPIAAPINVERERE